MDNSSAPGRSLRQAAVARMQQTHGNNYVARVLAQRQADTSPGPAGAPAAAATATPPEGLIVEDAAAEPGPGRMRKSEFLAELRTSVYSAAEDVLGGSVWAPLARPEIDRTLAEYASLDSRSLESTLRARVPEASAATTARGYIPFICERVRASIRAHLPAGGSEAGTSDGLLSSAAAAVTGLVESAGSAISGLFFKSREGGAREADDPEAIRAQLGAGQTLDNPVRSAMESAFGHDFSGVRVHADGQAAGLSEGLNARAFTVGEHMAFGAGEYRPGTPVGDALIAHELAHVVQQGGSATSEPLRKGSSGDTSLEQDADVSASGAVMALWGRGAATLGSIAASALPQLKSGLRLARCSHRKAQPVQGPAPAPTPAPQPAPTPTPAPTPAPAPTPTPPAPGTIRRVNLTGLSVGFQGNDLESVVKKEEIKDPQTKQVIEVKEHKVKEYTSESAKGKAVVFVPDGAKSLKAPQTLDVVLHLHGYNVGYRAGSPRAKEVDSFDSQLSASGRMMVGILPQGGYKSDFGSFNSDTYITEIFKTLTTRGDIPAGVLPGRVVLSGHSGAGGRLSQMFQSDLAKMAGQKPGGGPTLPSNMGEIVLYDAINDSTGSGERAVAKKWVLAQLDRNLADLKKAKADAVASGQDQNAAQLNYLKISLRFRGYYSHTSNDYYAKSYEEIEQAINKWFADHAGDLGGGGSSVYSALRNNYRIIDTKQPEHNLIGLPLPALGGKRPLEDALTAFPP